MSNIELSEHRSIEEILSSLGVYASVTKGGSMLPLLRAGRDAVYIVPLTRPLKKYDVILFRQGEKYILHRIIKFTEGGYICRGDNNFFTESVAYGDVIGVLIRYQGNGKTHEADTSAFRLRGALVGISYPVRLLWRKARRLGVRLLRKIKGEKND